jgi:RNA polymerase-binding transcription factor DksA
MKTDNRRETYNYHNHLNVIEMESLPGRTIKQVGDALEKIAGGGYGFCSECHITIQPDPLRTMPFATLCRDCQDYLDGKGREKYRL